KRTSVSRPPGWETIALTGQYKAWQGVRYKNLEDDAQAADQAGFGSFGSPGRNPYGYSHMQPPGDPNLPNPDFAVLYRMADHIGARAIMERENAAFEREIRQQRGQSA